MNSATVIDSDLNRVITVLSEVTSSISCHWLAGRFPLTFQLRHQSSSNLWAKCKKTEEVQRFFELNLEYLPHSIPRQMSAQPYLNVGAMKPVWCALISQTRSSWTASFTSTASVGLHLILTIFLNKSFSSLWYNDKLGPGFLLVESLISSWSLFQQRLWQQMKAKYFWSFVLLGQRICSD